jgi:uncharacterized protein YbaR (Trm112 family)
MDTFDEDFFINCFNGHLGCCAKCLSFMVTDNCPLCRENLFLEERQKIHHKKIMKEITERYEDITKNIIYEYGDDDECDDELVERWCQTWYWDILSGINEWFIFHQQQKNPNYKVIVCGQFFG